MLIPRLLKTNRALDSNGNTVMSNVPKATSSHSRLVGRAPANRTGGKKAVASVTITLTSWRYGFGRESTMPKESICAAPLKPVGRRLFLMGSALYTGVRRYSITTSTAILIIKHRKCSRRQKANIHPKARRKVKREICVRDNNQPRNEESP